MDGVYKLKKNPFPSCMENLLTCLQFPCTNECCIKCFHAIFSFLTNVSCMLKTTKSYILQIDHLYLKVYRESNYLNYLKLELFYDF